MIAVLECFLFLDANAFRCCNNPDSERLENPPNPSRRKPRLSSVERAGFGATGIVSMLLRIEIIRGSDFFYCRDTEKKNQCDFNFVSTTEPCSNSSDTRLKWEKMFDVRNGSFVRAVSSGPGLSWVDGDMLDRHSSKGISDMDFPVVRLDHGWIREFAVTTFQGKDWFPVFAVPGNGNIEHLPAMGCTMGIALRVIIDQQVPSVGKRYCIGSGIGIGQGSCRDQTPCSSPVG